MRKLAVRDAEESSIEYHNLRAADGCEDDWTERTLKLVGA